MSLYCGLIGAQNTILLKFPLRSLFVFVHYLLKHTVPRGGLVTEEGFFRRAQHSQADFNFICICGEKKVLRGGQNEEACSRCKILTCAGT